MVVEKLIRWLKPQRLVPLAFRLRPASEFIIFQGQRLTRRQVFTRVEQLAAGLQALGVKKGDRVATLLPACPEAVYPIFLPSMLGAVIVPLNPFLGEHELRHILADCGARVVITARNWYGQDYPKMLARLLPDLPDLCHILVREASDGDGRVFLPLNQVMSPGKPLRRTTLSGSDPIIIYYTSGTTGRPKGALHTHGRIWGILARSARARLGLSPLRCLLLPFSPYQFAGLFGIVVTLLAGGKVILMDHFDPHQMLEYIQRERVSQIGGSATMYRLLLLTPGQERYDLSSVRRLTFSAEPMPFDLAQALYERMRCNLENFYGTSESMLISWTGVDDPWERAASTVGKPVPGARVRILDDERRPLTAGERGEVAVQTSQMMMGYYNDPELTAQVLDAEGWFHTGDIGYVGEDGCLRLVDRKKDLILRGGQNIYPLEIEQYLERHPAIRRAAVIGVPWTHSLRSGLRLSAGAGEAGGEAVMAYLELQPGAKLSVKEVLEFCRGQIAPFKIPEQVRFVERLPTTATNKVQKFRLREMAAQELSPDATA
ncbi:MAG: acyl--CoA ligase [Candidatus Aminicenantes bacterium]|nr:acyl--CoA ligase [Candidatus Aminicenantes bacterium]